MTTSLYPASGRGVSQLDGLLQTRHARPTSERHNAHAHSGGPVTLMCASGRGGSGTSLVSALLAFAAAGDGFRVLLVDADEHVGPLSMMLGIAPRATWQDLRGGRVSPFDVATRMSTTLTVIAGGIPKMSPASAAQSVPVSVAERRACMRRLSAVTQGMDLVIIDCGARFESISAAITPHANERLVAVSAGTDPIGLASTYALCKVVHSRHSALPLDVLVNRYDGSEAQRCFDAIDAGARQFLGNALRFAGAVPTDSTLDAALRAGMPFLDAAAGSPAAIAAHDVVMRTLAGTSSTRPGA